MRVTINLSKGKRTKSEFAKECDINHIMAKFDKTGRLPALIKQNPIYGDFTTLPSYMEAQQIIINANNQFDALSRELKGKFNGRPEEFLAYVNDPANKAELQKEGLLPKDEETITTEPAKTEVPK